MNHLSRIDRFALIAGIVIGLAAPAAAVADDESPANWQGSATGTTKPGVGGDDDAFSGYSAPFGPFTGAGSHVLNPATGHFTGSAVWTASKGDTLKVSYSGDVTPSGNPLYPYGFKGVLTANGGTGRLSHATGSAVWMGGFTGVPGKFFFVFDGTLKDVDDVADGNNFKAKGEAGFTNLVKGTQAGGIVPYLGAATSPLIGPNIQTGSILNLSGLVAIDATTLVFLGEVGPHPSLPGNPAIHLIVTDDGTISCTWTAVFTLKIINANGDAVFSGDGDFQVVGGTGHYKKATGRFRTFFETGVVKHGADAAFANVSQEGKIRLH